MSCNDCGTSDGMHIAAAFCPACSIRRIPKPYTCPRCNRPYSISSKEDACGDCRTEEEQMWLVNNWPELRKDP